MIAVPLEFHATSEQLPDDETTVLMLFSDAEFELGFHVSGKWRLNDQSPLPPGDSPLAWAHLPDPEPILSHQSTQKP